jgi:hypothetical protein
MCCLLSIYPSIYLSVWQPAPRLQVIPSDVLPSVYLAIRPSVYLSVWRPAPRLQVISSAVSLSVSLSVRPPACLPEASTSVTLHPVFHRLHHQTTTELLGP